MQSLFFILPTTEPSSATKTPATASTPWMPATACVKDRTIEWVHTGRWVIGCLEAISVWSMAPVWHSTETSASTGHRTLTHWSSSIKSWHNNPSFQYRIIPLLLFSYLLPLTPAFSLLPFPFIPMNRCLIWERLTSISLWHKLLSPVGSKNLIDSRHCKSPLSHIFLWSFICLHPRGPLLQPQKPLPLFPLQ